MNLRMMLLMASLIMQTAAEHNDTDITYCEEYQDDGVCDLTDPVETDKRRHIYIRKPEVQQVKEKQLQYLLLKIENHRYLSCISFIKHVLCYLFFPLCPMKNGKLRSVKHLCREDCHMMKTTLCIEAVEHIPELKKLLIGINCTSFQSTQCMHLNIPSEQKTLESSCMVSHQKPKTYFAKVYLLRKSSCKTILIFNSNFYYPSILNYHQQVHSSSRDKRICIEKTKPIKQILKKIQTNHIKKLRKFEVEDIISFQIHKYCVMYSYNHIMKYFKGILGDLEEYRPHKYLTLKNTVFSLIKNDDEYHVIGEGLHELCYTRFQYIIMAENKMVDIFHAVSKDSIKMSLIELSHTLKRWVGKHGRYILTSEFQLFSSMVIYRPTWSIIWLNEERITGFKGTSCVTFKNKVVKNVLTEIIIGVEQDFWMLRMSLNKMKFYDMMSIITASYDLPIAFLPYINEKWNKEIIISKIVFTFATNKIKLPFSEYAVQKYQIYKEFIEGRIYEGTMITVNGIIKRPISDDAELPLLESRSGFAMEIWMCQNDTMKFSMLFETDSNNVNCYDKKKNEWQHLLNLVEKMQNKTYNKDSKTINETQSKCNICCDRNKNILHSITGRLYYDINWFSDKAVHLDFDINILNGKKIMKYQIRGYNPFQF